jgi:class 3 adenylate cyclase
MKMLPVSLFALLTVCYCSALMAQTGTTNKQKQLEDLKNQLIEEQKTIQQQQEWNTQSSQQEIKKLNQENQQKSKEVQASRQEAQTAVLEASKAKAELASKQIELLQTQVKIDSAKELLAETDSLLQTSQMQQKRLQDALQHQEDSVKMQQLQLVTKQTELDAQKAKNNMYILIAGISLSLLSIIAVLFLSRQKTLRELGEKNVIIEEEKRRSDELLLNILPEEVMHELKAHGKAQARNYSLATVLFADIKNFTKISEQLTPDEVIEALDTYFERFDRVIAKYNIEKIKTIGDAYVCAGGIPTKNIDNPQMVVKAALEFMGEVEKLKIERTKAGMQAFEFRFGIHTGQLVAGVVGIRKFAYDIWGDTVNMAARMQQEGEVGKVNISGATYELVKDRFLCIHRGKHAAKNKGEIDMYFVEKAI